MLKYTVWQSVKAPPRASRPARTPVQGIRARVGTVRCTLANVSATGAMVKSRVDLPIGREAMLVLEVDPKPVSVRVRIERCEPVDVALPSAVWRRQEYALGVSFIETSTELQQVLKRLTKEVSRTEETFPRVLVLGEEDQISKLIDKTLSGAEYVPRLLTYPRYAVSTAKRIGAKAVIVNLRIDPEFSVRSILDTLRADAMTSQLPVIVCARHGRLRPEHQTYLSERRLRLLLVPFTPEDLVLTLDRAVTEGY